MASGWPAVYLPEESKQEFNVREGHHRKKRHTENIRLEPGYRRGQPCIGRGQTCYRGHRLRIDADTHGTANLALYDQATWDKYQLTQLAGEEFQTNTSIVERKAAAANPANYEDPAGPFSGDDNSIPALMRRGVVFLSCHNAIWEQAAARIKVDIDPDKLSHAALAAELTNHLVDGVVLIPGAAGTLPELQQAGFHCAK